MKIKCTFFILFLSYIITFYIDHSVILRCITDTIVKQTANKQQISSFYLIFRPFAVLEIFKEQIRNKEVIVIDDDGSTEFKGGTNRG